MELAHLRRREIFVGPHRTCEVHDKSTIQQRVTSEISSFPATRVSRRTGCSCHACSSYREKNASQRETMKKKGRTRRWSSFAADSVKSFSVAHPCFSILLVIDSAAARCALHRCIRPYAYACVLSRHSYAPRVANVGYCSAP